MPVIGPVRRTEPPSSASSPRPRTNMRLGALTLTSSLTTLGRDVGIGVPSLALARRSVSRTAFDASMCLTSSAAAPPAQRFGHGDLGAVDGDVARKQRVAQQRPGHRQAAAQGRNDEVAVGIAGIVERDADVGGQAASQRNRSCRADRATACDRCGSAADRDGVAVDGGVERDVAQPQIGFGSTTCAPDVETVPLTAGFLQASRDRRGDRDGARDLRAAIGEEAVGERQRRPAVDRDVRAGTSEIDTAARRESSGPPARWRSPTTASRPDRRSFRLQPP